MYADREESTPSLILMGVDQPNFSTRKAYLLERDHRTNYIGFIDYMSKDLKSLISEEEFASIVNGINELCAEACKPCKWENLIDVLTLFLFYYFFRNHFYRTVERLKQEVRKMNETFMPSIF